MDKQFDLYNLRRNLIIHGERRILDLLKKRGFRLREKEVRLSVEDVDRELGIDYLVHWKDRSFALEVKVVQKLADWLFHSLSHSILVLQAARRLKEWDSLLAIYADSLDLRIVRRLKGQIALYAPDLWWIVADANGNLVAHLPSGDEEEIGDLRKRERALGFHPESVGSSPSFFNSHWSKQDSPMLSFSDLDQWLLKVLLFARSQAEGWGGPRGPIRNLAQLAKLASVSPPLVYRWAAAMERSGYLSKQRRRVPILVSLNALLAEWRGRYRVSHNKQIACSSVFGDHSQESFRGDFLNRLRQLPVNAPPCALSGHQASWLYRLKHSDARSIHLYVSGESAGLMKHLQLVESQNAVAPVMLLEPRHIRSVFGGLSRIDGVPVCDILQVYLDLYYLPDRGREQAEFIHERMLEPIMRAGTEPSDEM